MADRFDDVFSTTLLTALGGTVNANDRVFIRKWSPDYANGTLANDLLRLSLGDGFRGSFAAGRGGGQLVCVVNQSGAGVLEDLSNASLVEVRSTSSSAVIAQVRHMPANGHKGQLGTCRTTDLYVGGGTYEVLADVDLTNAFLVGGSTTFRKTAGPGTFPLTLVRAAGNAVAIIERDVTTIDVEHGSFVRLTDPDCTPGTITMRGGELWPELCGDITTLQGLSGLIDLTKRGTPITIGTQALGPGVTIRLRRGGITPTVTVNADVGGGPKYEYV